ncbi:MAG TPA: ABC transporter substrate-binding protein [Thermodesulfobacteriota bacterium]
MKKIVALIAMAIFLLGATSGVFAAEEPVKIGYLRIVMSLPTYVAQDKGFFTQEGLKVELMPFDSGTAIIEALMAGRIDCIACTGTDGLWYAALRAPERLKIFLLYGTTFDNKEDNSFSVVVKKGSPLKGFKDLKGKKVGTYPGGSSVALARAVIRTQIDPAKVIFTEIAPPNMIQTLAAGQIDAFFAPEPSGMIAVAQGVGRYLMKGPLVLLQLRRGIPGAAFAFSAKLLQKRPEQARKLKACLDKAVDYIRSNEKEVRPYLVKYTGLPEAVAMSISFDQWIKLDEYDKRAGQEYFDLLYKEGAYKERVDTTELYYY